MCFQLHGVQNDFLPLWSFCLFGAIWRHVHVWVTLIRAGRPWSHFRGLFISVVLHFSSLICIKGPGWPLTPHTFVSPGMCLPDVDACDPQAALKEQIPGSSSGIARWQHTKVELWNVNWWASLKFGNTKKDWPQYAKKSDLIRIIERSSHSFNGASGTMWDLIPLYHFPL